MKEYFMLEQSEDVVNPIKLILTEPQKYTAEMTHKQFKELEEVSVAYTQYEKTQEIPDILVHPTFMIAEEMKKVFEMYDDNISFKAVQVFPDRMENIEYATKLYWVYDCVSEDCMHGDTVKFPNGEIKELILDKRKVKGRDIFRVRGLMENKVVVSLAVAESILRRKPYGVSLKKVSMR